MKYAEDYRKTLLNWQRRLGDLSVRVVQVGNYGPYAYVSADTGSEPAAVQMTAEECEEFAAKLLEAARVLREHQT